jgi:hypothetical protein
MKKCCKKGRHNRRRGNLAANLVSGGSYEKIGVYAIWRRRDKYTRFWAVNGHPFVQWANFCSDGRRNGKSGLMSDRQISAKKKPRFRGREGGIWRTPDRASEGVRRSKSVWLVEIPAVGTMAVPRE